MDVGELLQQSVWMRRLARSLVRDNDAADDLVQETWVAALRHPPRAGAPPRPWLRQVLHNVLRARLRSDSRRARREEASSEPDAQATPTDHLVGAVELQRLLAEAVLALEEPYRSTILLCFYEGLTAAEVAERQGVPAGTVRWRVKEALDRLRRRLDSQHRGDRAAWLGALAPFSDSQWQRATALKGAATMKIALSFLVLGGAAAGVVAVKVKSRQGSPPPVQARPVAVASPEKPRMDAQTRAQMLQRIEAARKTARPGGMPAAKEPELNAEYVHDQIKELLPLFKECFERAVERTPNLSGKVVLSFTIVGDPTVGGLVSESHVVEDKSTITDPEAHECFQETIYAARFPPPGAGGEMQIEFPFVLKPAADDLP